MVEIKPCKRNKDKHSLVVAQITDCHLFAEKNALHHGANVYHNLQRVLAQVASNKTIDVIVFTGDLTQDHSEQSYINFSVAVQSANVQVPMLFLAGNHDDEHLLTKHLVGAPFSKQRCFTNRHWQLILLNSKSDTPAGWVSEESLLSLVNTIDEEKYQLCFMHHHPVNVGYFIDRHGLENKADFWQTVTPYISIKAIACGHVHQALQLGKCSIKNPETIDVYACPATSIQFDPQQATTAALSIKPAYRLFYLDEDGTLATEVIEC